MRKRFVVVVVLALAVIAGTLTAAKVVVIPNHIVLHGGPKNMALGALGAVGVQRPQGVPASAASKTITLHGTTIAGKGVAPALGGGSWTCSVTQYAWQNDAHTMVGDAAYNCSGATLIDFSSQFSDYCAPILWGCQWQTKYTYGGCTYPNPTFGACPKSGTFIFVYNIASGQLWGEGSNVCAYGPPGTTSQCGQVFQQVQF